MREGPATQASALVSDPVWLAHRYDPGHDAVHLRWVPRARRQAVPFLTDQHLGTAPPVVVRRGEAVAVAQPAPLHFIFHSAYCCSTLLSSLLDIHGVASSLSEPVILNDIVGWRRRRAPTAAVKAVLNDTLTILARPLANGEAVIVKPSNVANCLIEDILELRPASRAVLLRAPPRDYLLSIAKKGETGRQWSQTLLSGLHRDKMVGLGFSFDDLRRLEGLQVAALGWLTQHLHFAALIERFGANRLRPLDSATLLARPAAALVEMSGLFELPLLRPLAEGLAGGAVLQAHSKSGRPFNAADRAAEQLDAAARYGAEVDAAERWLYAIASRAGASLDLAPALVAPERAMPKRFHRRSIMTIETFKLPMATPLRLAMPLSLLATGGSAAARPVVTFDATLATHLQAVAARDLPTLERTLTSGTMLELYLPNGKMTETRREFVEFHRGWFTEKSWTMKFTPVSVRRGRDLASATLRTRYEDVVDGKPYWSESWLTLTFRREKDGWRLVHDQNSRIRASTDPN